MPFFITLNAHPTIKANKTFCFTYTLTNGLTRTISHIFLSCFLAWKQDLMAKGSHQHLQQFECTNVIGGSLCKGFLIDYSSKRKSHITNITLVVHSAFPTLVLHGSMYMNKFCSFNQSMAILYTLLKGL